MTMNFVVPYGTLFRVWLYKKPTASDACLNFELEVKWDLLKTEDEELAASNMRCDHLTAFPQTLNTDRYLGL